MCDAYAPIVWLAVDELSPEHQTCLGLETYVSGVRFSKSLSSILRTIGIIGERIIDKSTPSSFHLKLQI